jgi:lysozyme family protein
MSETTPRAITTASTVPSYGKFWPEAAGWWDRMERNKLSMAQGLARKILANKARYQNVESKTGVPWYWIGPTHFRESDCDFRTQLAQGDPLGKVSTHVPKGQGPYFGADAWDRAALIALEHDKLTEKPDDYWRLERLFFHWESYNGWGYRLHGVPSAYVWAGTNIYTQGFYVADGAWSQVARDSRVGCVPVLKCLLELDSTISIRRESANSTDEPIYVGGQPGPVEPPIGPPIEPDDKTEIKIVIEDGKVTVYINGVAIS